MEILRYLTSPHGSSKCDFEDTQSRAESNQLEEFGSEWVEIDEPVGVFMRQLRRRRQRLQLDQVNDLLHYDNYRKVMRVQDISFVRSVEELDDSGKLQWWMSIQDSTSVQVWIVHFSSLQRLQAWVVLLRSFSASPRIRSLIGDIIHANGSSPHSIKTRLSSITKETILTMTPEQKTI